MTIKKIGNSLGIIIPKIISDQFALHEKDEMLIDFKYKVSQIQEQEYRCRKCQHRVYGINLNEFDLYCSSCGCEDLELVEEVEE